MNGSFGGAPGMCLKVGFGTKGIINGSCNCHCRHIWQPSIFFPLASFCNLLIFRFNKLYTRAQKIFYFSNCHELRNKYWGLLIVICKVTVLSFLVMNFVVKA